MHESIEPTCEGPLADAFSIPSQHRPSLSALMDSSFYPVA